MFRDSSSGWWIQLVCSSCFVWSATGQLAEFWAWLNKWLSTAWSPVKERFATAGSTCAVWLSDCCLVRCTKHIQERGEGGRERTVEDKRLLDMCGFPPYFTDGSFTCFTLCNFYLTTYQLIYTFILSSQDCDLRTIPYMSQSHRSLNS
jgi:hypothetical protein